MTFSLLLRNRRERRSSKTFRSTEGWNSRSNSASVFRIGKFASLVLVSIDDARR